MSYKDLFTYTKPTQTLAPAARIADATGASVDRKLNESAIVVVNVGAYTDGAHTFILQESDDDTTFTAVAVDQLQGTAIVVDGAPDAAQAYHIGYLGSKRYLRVFVDVVGATTGAFYGVTIVQDYPRFAGGKF